jgi:hypothetical protein
MSHQSVHSILEMTVPPDAERSLSFLCGRRRPPALVPGTHPLPNVFQELAPLPPHSSCSISRLQ